MKKLLVLTIIFFLFFSCVFNNPFLPSSQTDIKKKVSYKDWTWMAGSDLVNQSGAYGTKDVPGPLNTPGARAATTGCSDSLGNLWLFGGIDFGAGYIVNDLWKFDGKYWTWISGTATASQYGIYGLKGTADTANIPGGRFRGLSWTDKSDNFWIFGGFGNGRFDSFGYLNDLWKFDGTNWTWVSGSDLTGQAGHFGIKGVTDSADFPGGRQGSISWKDSSGNFWIFGGQTDAGNLNDLWKFDGTNWTWISGSNTVNQPGIYGTKGIPGAANIPGGRWVSVSWIDSGNNLWIFGGQTTAGFLNDLWKFDGANWTWISGSDTVNQSGIYGIQGVPDMLNIPGARYVAYSWTDDDDNLWLFGGSGYDSAGNFERLNDLWKFDGTYWSWISGSAASAQSGIYGLKGIAAPSNIPGGRQDSISWKDRSGNFFLFGGAGYDSANSIGFLNDVWRYRL